MNVTTLRQELGQGEEELTLSTVREGLADLLGEPLSMSLYPRLSKVSKYPNWVFKRVDATLEGRDAVFQVTAVPGYYRRELASRACGQFPDVALGKSDILDPRKLTAYRAMMVAMKDLDGAMSYFKERGWKEIEPSARFPE